MFAVEAIFTAVRECWKSPTYALHLYHYTTIVKGSFCGSISFSTDYISLMDCWWFYAMFAAEAIFTAVREYWKYLYTPHICTIIPL